MDLGDVDAAELWAATSKALDQENASTIVRNASLPSWATEQTSLNQLTAMGSMAEQSTSGLTPMLTGLCSQPLATAVQLQPMQPLPPVSAQPGSELGLVPTAQMDTFGGLEDILGGELSELIQEVRREEGMVEVTVEGGGWWRDAFMVEGGRRLWWRREVMVEGGRKLWWRREVLAFELGSS